MILVTRRRRILCCRLPPLAPGLDAILGLDNLLIYPEFVEGMARCSTVSVQLLYRFELSSQSHAGI